ncbi:MAG: tetratricopeptide repeat protein, partial [Opitutaceae bacterium]
DTFSEPKALQAVAEFEQSIALDPEFAQAYAGLADAHLNLGYTFRDPAVHLAKAKAYVAEALKRDETLVEAIIVDGAVKYFFDWDWSAAERAVKQAVLLDPSALENFACYLHSLETIGRTDDALKTVQLASAHHPSSISIQSELGCSAYYAGRFDEAVAYLEQTLKNDPDNAFLHWGIGRTLAQQGKLPAAAAILEAGQRKPGGDWTGLLTELAYVRAREGRASDALVLIEQLRTRAKTEYVDPYLLAMAYAGLGDANEVFKHLDLAVQGRSSWIPNLPVDPKFAALRSEPRFQRMLASLKLPPKS